MSAGDPPAAVGQAGIAGVAATARKWFGGRRVLVTGHNGFVGTWVSLWLTAAGADVVGVSLPAAPGHLADAVALDDVVRSEVADVRDAAAMAGLMARLRPDFVFHLAAQAFVLPSYDDPVATLAANVMGTAHVLEAVRRSPSVAGCVVVTSDKCYAGGNRPHPEDDALGGHDPYSASKAAAEIVAHSYRLSFLAKGGVGLATARAGNIVGGGDYGRDRLVPDFVLAARGARHLVLRRPGAVRPWQHVLDAVAGYLLLGAALLESPKEVAEGWNFGPAAEDLATVGTMVEHLSAAWTGRGGTAPKVHCAPGPAPFEEPCLVLDTNKARVRLGWRPALGAAEAAGWAVDWYWASQSERPFDARKAVLDQIDRFGDLVSGARATEGVSR